MKDFLLKRLHEPSTWRGIVMLATALGLALSPEQVEAIVATGVAIVGLLGMFTADPERVRDPAESDGGTVGVQRRAEDRNQSELELDGRGFGDK